MTPTFLESNDRIGIIGTPGGSRIISMVLISSLEFVDGKLPGAWVKKERFHHQYMPDILQFEKDAFSPSLQQELERRGHELKEVDRNTICTQFYGTNLGGKYTQPVIHGVKVWLICRNEILPLAVATVIGRSLASYYVFNGSIGRCKAGPLSVNLKVLK